MASPKHNPHDSLRNSEGELRQFIVLGVHRSGTSLLTETAIRLGLYGGSPEELDGADEWNANGYWEHRAVRALDEELLAEAGTDWFGAPSFDLAKLPGERRDEFFARAGAIVSSLDESAPWIVKDPRMCVLLPFWRPFLSNHAFLFSLRHPLAVARSIHARDGFPTSVGIALWETQLLTALASAKGVPRAVFWYEDLVARPVEETQRLAEFLRMATGGRAGSANPPPAADPSLRHHMIDAAEERDRLPAGAGRLLEALRSGEAFGDSFDTAPSEDARELIGFVEKREHTRRFLEAGWRRQQAAHRDAVETLEQMIKAKDEYIEELNRPIKPDRVD